jgi:hypothetical protein
LANVNQKGHTQVELKPYPLKKVKELLKSGHYRINGNALISAENDFNWGPAEIIKCLLKLKSRHCVAVTTKANFFGELSKGGKQLRGNGALILTKEDVYFIRALPFKKSDAMAWAVKNPESWKKALEKLITNAC